MKTRTKIFCIAMFAMLFFAVQSYAQRHVNDRHRSTQLVATKKVQTVKQEVSLFGFIPFLWEEVPSFRHNALFRHYEHKGDFEGWRSFPWGGYTNRFIVNVLYHNRYYDNLLGYYVWGKMDKPFKLKIGPLTFMRNKNSLKVRNGKQVSYIDLYQNQAMKYLSENTKIDVNTANGYALIRFYDALGNEAIYRV